jgi:hypothetical protein
MGVRMGHDALSWDDCRTACLSISGYRIIQKGASPDLIKLRTRWVPEYSLFCTFKVSTVGTVTCSRSRSRSRSRSLLVPLALSRLLCRSRRRQRLIPSRKGQRPVSDLVDGSTLTQGSRPGGGRSEDAGADETGVLDCLARAHGAVARVVAVATAAAAAAAAAAASGRGIQIPSRLAETVVSVPVSGSVWRA